MALVLTSAPVVEPVTLSEAKAHLRVDGAAEDTLIGSLILTSRLHIETALGLALITQGWRLSLDAWPEGRELELPLRPLQAVREVRVFSADNMSSLVPAETYLVDLAGVPPRLVRRGAMWIAPGRPAGGIEIDFTAGYGDAASDVPAPLRQALLMLVAHWYEHREPVELGSPVAAVPSAAYELLAPYRTRRI